MIVGLSGCYYTAPFIHVDDNVPPTIKASSPSDGETINLTLPTAEIFVVAEDEDGDAIFCDWYMDVVGELGPGEPLQNDQLKGCRITLVQKSDYDQLRLHCAVWDSQDFSEVSWPVSVPVEVQ